jgi:prepilin-type N-terminal cleavage/methylation domain-containing protein
MRISKKGFTLIELMGAIVVISIGVAAALRVMPSIISDTTVNVSRVTAAFLAQEGIEIIRNIKDTNWLQINNGEGQSWDHGFGGCGVASPCEVDYYCVTTDSPIPSYHDCFRNYGNYLKLDSNNFYNYTSGSNTKFKRKIIIQSEGQDIIVTVEVFWQDRGKNYNFLAKEKLYEW